MNNKDDRDDIIFLINAMNNKNDRDDIIFLIKVLAVWLGTMAAAVVVFGLLAIGLTALTLAVTS